MRKKGELNSKAMHLAYKEIYKSTIPLGLFRSILEVFNKECLSLLLEGVELKLPFRLGSIYVEKRKVNFNHLKLDYGHWQKTGEKSFHINRHSDNFQAYFHWRKIGVNVKGNSWYQFRPCRKASRDLAVCMKEEGGHKRYVQYKPPLLPNAVR